MAFCFEAFGRVCVCLKLPGETFCNAYISFIFPYPHNPESKTAHFSSSPREKSTIKEIREHTFGKQKPERAHNPELSGWA